MAYSLFGKPILTQSEKDRIRTIQNGARIYIARVAREEKERKEKERREQARREAERREAERRELERLEALRRERERLEAERRERERLEEERRKAARAEQPEEPEEEEEDRQFHFEGRYSIADSSATFATSDRYFENAALYSGFPYLTDVDLIRKMPEIHTDMTFTEKLYQIMQQRSLKSPDVYRKANIDKSLFSRILSDRAYSPKKDTAIAIAFGLGLNHEQAQDLLKRAGYAFSHSVERDAAIEYCFMNGMDNVIEVDLVLDGLGLAPLSRA